MTTAICSPPAPSIDACPSDDEMRPQVFALLPRGRAWDRHDGGPWPGSVIYGFFDAIASMRAWFNRRMCDMRRQFWCATTDEMRDVWLAQYGLPDDCDPFPDLCQKVSALGGARCEYFKAVAARKGWAIDCIAVQKRCGAKFGKSRFGTSGPVLGPGAPRFGKMRFGRKLSCAMIVQKTGASHFGGASSALLQIVVYLRSSPSYQAPTVRAPRFGRMRFGHRLSCPTNTIAPLQCLIERIAPAHAQVVYRTV